MVNKLQGSGFPLKNIDILKASDLFPIICMRPCKYNVIAVLTS